jgi:hypothetical protein
MRFELESDNGDILRLDGVEVEGRGVQVRSGVTGLGLPRKDVQYLEGAGDGALARGRRVLPRDIDLPLYIRGTDREDLKYWLNLLGRMLGYEHDHYFYDASVARLWLHLYDEDGTKWSAAVEHVGGGEFVYGVDTFGLKDLVTVITLRAGDPYFTREFADMCFMYETGA